MLASLHIDKIVTYYQERLGFDSVGWKDKNYAVIARDKIEIHFWKCNHKIHPEHTSCYILVKEVDGLYEEMKQERAVDPNGSLKDQLWKMREFANLDKDGTMIKLGENI